MLNEIQQSLVAERERDYALWIRKHTPQACDIQRYQRRIREMWQEQPAVHLLLVFEPGRENELADTMESLSAQIYPGWGLTVVATVPAVAPMFTELDQLEWREVSGDPKTALNEVVRNSPGAWVGVLEAGDRLAPHALFSCLDYLDREVDRHLVYVDEDSINADGQRHDPKFKPDFNLDLLRSMPYTGAFCLVRRDSLEAIGGIRNCAGLEAYDITLRILDQFGEPGIGHVDDVLFHRADGNEGRQPPELAEIGKLLVQEHLSRNGIQAEVAGGLLPHTFRIEYPLHGAPRVSIIIPTKDQPDLIKGCLDSLLEKTTYPNYEVLVMDNNTTDPQALAYLEQAAQADSRVKVLRYAKPYNFAAINNFAAAQAEGEYLLALNNDTVIIQPNWLERMVSLGQRDDVGIVGARLVYPDQRLQHAGVVLGMGGLADHAHMGLPLTDAGYMGRAQVVQDFSAVTAACLLIKRDVYQRVGGMDEGNLAVLMNDVDLCLKTGELGLKVVWTPFATLIHYGSMSLKTKEPDKADVERAMAEKLYALDKWLPRMARDPAFNRHLSLKNWAFRPETEVDVPWDMRRHDSARVMILPFDSFGSGQYRARAPLGALADGCRIQAAFMPNHDKPPEQGFYVVPGELDVARVQPDVIYVHNGLHDFHLTLLERWKKFTPQMRRIFSMDDLMHNAPKGHALRKTAYKDMMRRIRQAVSLSDRLVVSTEPLARAYGEYTGEVKVVPNYLDDARWTALTSARRQGRKPRVGWAGAQQHQDDLELLIPVVRETAAEVEWVFMGMCPDAIRPLVHEFHPGVVFDDYPARLAGLNLDLAVAPLAHHPYNEAKSNLRLLEYGILGWPVIATDILPYQNAPVHRVANNTRAWTNAIRERVHDLDALAEEGERLRRWVSEGWMLSQHLDEWEAAVLG